MSYATEDIFNQCIQSRIAEATANFEKKLKAVQDELQTIKTNRDEILAEKRILQGKNFSGVGVQQSATSLLISRDVARDPAEYQKYKASAAAQNLEFGILPDTKESRADKPMPDFFTSRTAHVISRDYARDPQNFQREKALAQSKGLTFHVAASAEEFPAEAFKEQS
jgi:hypothetical protein